MGIKLGSGFSYNAPKFLDERQGVAKNRGDLLNWSIIIPEGFQVYLPIDKCWYIYDPSEFSSETGYFKKASEAASNTTIYRDRGDWSKEVANSDEYYEVTETTTDVVWHAGCKYRCISNRTLATPEFRSEGWSMMEGNPNFTVELDSTSGWIFDFDRIRGGEIFTYLNVLGEIYNQDVTGKIDPVDVTWSRDTGDKEEDDAWGVKRGKSGLSLSLTVDDLTPDYLSKTSCSFIATVLLRESDGEVNKLKTRPIRVATAEVCF